MDKSTADDLKSLLVEKDKEIAALKAQLDTVTMTANVLVDQRNFAMNSHANTLAELQLLKLRTESPTA